MTTALQPLTPIRWEAIQWGGAYFGLIQLLGHLNLATGEETVSCRCGRRVYPEEFQSSSVKREGMEELTTLFTCGDCGINLANLVRV